MKHIPRPARFIGLSVAIASSLLVACTSDDAKPGGGVGAADVTRTSLDDGATFIPQGIEARNVVTDVSFKSGVVQVPADRFRTALTKVSADERTYTFSAAVDGFTGAAPGTVAMVEGVGILVVASARADGSSFLVEADPGELTDAIQNGRVEFDATVNVDSGARISTAKRPLGPSVAPDPPPADMVSFEGDRDGSGGGVAGGPTGAPSGGPAVGPGAGVGDGSGNPLEAEGARQAPGPNMTTVPLPTSPKTSDMVPPPNPDLSSPAYGASAPTTTSTTTSTTAPAAASVVPAGVRRVSAQVPGQAIGAEPPASAPGRDLTIGAAGKGNAENPDALPSPGLTGRAVMPDPAADALTGCSGPVCAIFGSAKSFDYVIDVQKGGGTTRLNYQMALKNEKVGQIWVGGSTVIDRLDVHFAAEINGGTITSQNVSARSLKYNGVLDFGARFSRTQTADESFLQKVHDRAGQVMKDDLGFRLETPDLADLTTAGEAAVAIQKLSNYYKEKWEKLEKDSTAAGAAITKLIGADNDILAGTDVVKVPLRIQVPIKAGPLTFSVSFGMDFAVVAAFSTNNSSARGHITYEGGGDGGFATTDGSVLATNDGLTMGATWKREPWAIQGMGSQGFSLTVSAPRIGIGTAIIGPVRGEAYLAAKNTITQLTPGKIMPIIGCSLSKVWTSLEVGLLRGKDDDLVMKKTLMKRGRWFQHPAGGLCDQQIGS